MNSYDGQAPSVMNISAAKIPGRATMTYSCHTLAGIM